MHRALVLLPAAVLIVLFALGSPLLPGAQTSAGASSGADPAWRPSTALRHAIQAVAVSRENPNIVLAGTPVGLYHSRDGGQTWQLSTDRILGETGILALSVSPTDDCTFYAVTIFDGLFRSRNCGYTWVRLAGRAPDPFPGLPQRRGPLGVPQLHYYRFEHIAPAETGAIYLGGETVALSVDGGVTWQERAAGLPADGNIVALRVEPQNALRLYAAVFRLSVGDGGARTGLASGLYRSDDGGASWAAMGQDVPLPSALALDARQPQVVVAGTYSDGIHRSIDAGMTWQHIAGLPRTLGVASLTTVPGAPGTFVAAAFDAGVYRSDDNGQTWQPLNEGLPSERRLQKMALTASREGLVAYVANDLHDAQGYRLWRRNLGPLPTVRPALPFRTLLPTAAR